MRITVLSTFDVWPPRDGGQSRYVALWTSFSRRHRIEIIAYEFRNTGGERRYKLADNVDVIVPVADETDAALFYAMSGRTALWTHDILCVSQYAFSQGFLSTLRNALDQSDVVVASHPYLAAVAFPMSPPRALTIYESYNVEFDIKREYLSFSRDAGLARQFFQDVRFGEAFAARTADHVTAVSEDDGKRMIDLYGLSTRKVSVVPNGAFVRAFDLLDGEGRQEAKRAMGVQHGPVGVFLGSEYSANVESYRRTRLLLDDAGFTGTIVLVGSISRSNRAGWPSVSFAETWLGFVDDDVRDVALSMADFALQMIFEGAGTNLKLFDYMGAGIPIIANGFGQRGVSGHDWCWSAETAEDLAQVLTAIGSDHAGRSARVARARAIARSRYDWRSIASSFESAMERGFGESWSGPASSEHATQQGNQHVVP